MSDAVANFPEVGDKAPDGKVVNKSGTVLRLSQLWSDSPLVLVFSRHKG
jgi:peroxiredoxin